MPEFTPSASWTQDRDLALRWRAAHRAALDHVLGLCAGRWWSDDLVLRGSMLLPALIGTAARLPADLDWVVVNGMGATVAGEPAGHLVDLIERYPRVESDGLLSDGFGLTRPTTTEKVGDDGDYHTYAGPAPSGSWTSTPPFGDLLDLVAEHPFASHGVVLDVGQAWCDEDWSSSTWCYIPDDYEAPGQRLVIPWRAPGLRPGRVQIDFVWDEVVPEMARPTLVPRADGGPPAVVFAASRELSLAWKVRWLARDSVPDDPETSAENDIFYRDGHKWTLRQVGRGKDLYDAVLLAEGCDAQQLRRFCRLLREVWGDDSDFALDNVSSWSVDWDSFYEKHPWVTGTAGEWLARLARHLPPARSIPQRS